MTDKPKDWLTLVTTDDKQGLTMLSVDLAAAHNKYLRLKKAHENLQSKHNALLELYNQLTGEPTDYP